MELRYHIQEILNAYRNGLFPMAEDANAENFFFYEPELRGILPIHTFHIPRSLAKIIRRGDYKVTCNTAFRQVIDGCAQTTQKRPKTWINKTIRDIFIFLHQAGYAHSIEAWDKNGQLVGGLYGLALGGVFFGESMFSRAPDASKTALVYLMARLWAGGFGLCDTQFINDHLSRFGAYETPQDNYLLMLDNALGIKAEFAGENIDSLYHTDTDMVLAYMDYLKKNA